MERQFQLNWTALIEEAKQRRKAQKLTQQKLAMLANVSTPTISRFENGEKDIQLSSVFSVFRILGMLDQRNLVFSDPNPGYDHARMVVIFWGEEGKKRVRCAISWEALMDHYKLEHQAPLKVFFKNQSAIQHEARRKYLENRLEADGSILIKTSDL